MNLRRIPGWLDPLALSLAVTAGWWRIYGRGLKTGLPPVYQDDALMMLARIQGYASGELMPFAPNYLTRLNAPFQAAWSDYPVEDFVYAPAGLLVRMLGLGPGTMVYLWLLQVMAGVGCYTAARLLRIGRDYAIAAGILFGLAPYAFQRGLAHLNLTVYWHVPLLILVLVWAACPETTRLDGRLGTWLAGVVALIAGLLCPYYSGPFLLLLGFILLGQIANREWPRVRATLITFAAAFLGLVLQNVDTLLFAWRHGPNALAVGRDYWGLVKFGLYLPDLLFPQAHPSALVQGLAREIYQSRVPPLLQGESQTAYIGLISLFGLGWLSIEGLIRISARRCHQVSPFFWLASGIFAYAVAGGLNHLLGAFGFLLLRATNRVSILLSAVALLYLAGRAARTLPGRIPLLIPGLMVLIGGYDQIPAFPSWDQQKRDRGLQDFRSDMALFRELERRLPAGAMVFQLPVKDFPESHTLAEMSDYEHFRPLLHTASLRYSYGTVKGRGDAGWQAVVAAKPTAEMVADLQRYGFAAILINRKAYPDRARSLGDGFGAALGAPMAQNGDFFVFRLTPDDDPEPPPMVEPIEMVYSSGFHAPEHDGTGEWRWAGRDATIRFRRSYRPPLYRPADEPIRAKLRFEIEAVKPDRDVWMSVPGQPPRRVLAANEPRREIELATVVGSEPVDVGFSSSRMSILPAADYRWLNFRLINPRLEFDAPGGR